MAKKKKKAPLTKPQLKKKVANERYYRQAKKLRATNAFGDLFKPGKGVDLRSPQSWPPHVKARVTKYAKELGPLIAGPTKTKRYFRPDHLRSAIEVSSQERMLPGQKAAIFAVDDFREDVKITFDRKHRPKVVRGGIEEVKINFDIDLLIRDPMAELERTLDASPGQFFKFVTGANESKQTMTRETMIDAMERYIVSYDPDEKPLGDFLYGIKAYPNVRSGKKLQMRDIKHSEQVTKRQRERLNVLAKTRRALTAAEKRSIRATGRKGRVR